MYTDASDSATVSSPALADRPASRRAGTGLVLAWLAFLVVLVALTLGAAEIGLRIRRDRIAAHLPDPPPADSRFVPDRLLGYTNKPSINYSSESRRHLTFHYANNALGLRGPETTPSAIARLSATSA